MGHREGFGWNRFFIRWIANGIAIWAAFQIVPGITPQQNSAEAIILVSLIFGLVNALIRPIIALLTCPLIILTLGLGTLIINTAMFALAGQIGTRFGVGYQIDGFWPAFFGALVVSIVSGVLSSFLGERRYDHQRDE